jgi:hypothetical protein
LTLTPAERAYQLANGFRATQLVSAAAELRIPDLIADGLKSADELSGPTGIDPGRLRRLLRALAALGVLSEAEDGRYANTDVGELFRENVQGSNFALVRMLVPESYRGWDHLMETLRTGVTGHSLAWGGTLWDSIARDPDYRARFNAGMAWNTQNLTEFVAGSGNFDGASLAIDVGGGKGSLIAGVLKAHRNLRGIVFGLKAGLADTAEYLAEQGVAERCQLVEGNFFESVPAADVYLLKDILHDWDDEHAAAILRVCRRAMDPQSRVMVVERVLPSRITDSAAHLNAAITDMQMMVQLGGQERTLEEYDALFEAAELERGAFRPGGVYKLVEAIPV